jgi:hypothetical protein
MKKTMLTLALFVAFYIPGFSQKKIMYQISAGMNSSMVKSETDNEKTNSKSILGFAAGITAKLPVGNHFTIEPGLNFLQKGGKDKQDQYTANVTLDYLEMPVNLVYNTGGKSGKFFIGAGPSIAYAVFGKVKAENGGVAASVKLKFGNGPDDDLKPMDLGANFITGYRLWNGIVFGANYNIGLSNLMTDAQGGKWNNYYFGLRLGYEFGGKKKAE